MDKEKLNKELMGHRQRFNGINEKLCEIYMQLELLEKEKLRLKDELLTEKSIIQSLSFVEETEGFTKLPAQQERKP
jgi:hypothetical protein